MTKVDEGLAKRVPSKESTVGKRPVVEEGAGSSGESTEGGRAAQGMMKLEVYADVSDTEQDQPTFREGLEVAGDTHTVSTQQR